MKLVIKNCRLFDSVDGDIKPNSSVFIRDGKIEYVGDEKAFPGDINQYEELSSEAKAPFVMPGMIDAHLHLGFGGFDTREKFQGEGEYIARFVHNGIKNLLSGVTTVRDCGSRFHYDVKYKKALSLNMFPGPKTYVSGQPIIATGGHCPYMSREADGPYEVRKAVREQIAQQVDFIKLMVTGGLVTPTGELNFAQLTNEEIAAAVEVAHMNNRKVSAHAYGGDSIKDLIKIGVDILDHGIQLTDEYIEVMVHHNTVYVPTLSAIYSYAELNDHEPVPHNALAVEKAKYAVKYHFESVRKAREAGILIAAGTDYKHGQLDFELELLTRAGFSKTEALLCATRNAAKIIGDFEAGTIEVGKRADILILDGDPTQDLGALKKVKTVIQNGRIACHNGMLAWTGDYLVPPIQ